MYHTRAVDVYITSLPMRNLHKEYNSSTQRRHILLKSKLHKKKYKCGKREVRESVRMHASMLPAAGELFDGELFDGGSPFPAAHGATLDGLFKRIASL